MGSLIQVKEAFKEIFNNIYGYYYTNEYLETIAEFPLRTILQYLNAYKPFFKKEEITKDCREDFIEKNKDIFLSSLIKFGFDQEFFDISRGEKGIDIFANKALSNFNYTDIKEFKPITSDLDKNITLILTPQYFNLYTNFSEYIDWGLKFILPMFLKEIVTSDRSKKSNKKNIENLENFERKLRSYVNFYEDVYKKIFHIQPILAEKNFLIAQTYKHKRGLEKIIEEDMSKKVKDKFNLSDSKLKDLYKKLKNNANQENINLNDILKEVIEDQTQISEIVKFLRKEDIENILQAKALNEFDRECNNFLNVECIYYAIPKVYIPYYEKGEKLGYLSPLDVLYFFFLIISENDEKLRKFIFEKLNIQDDKEIEETEQQENIENEEIGQRENTENNENFNQEHTIDFYEEFKGFISNWDNEFKDLINIHLLQFNKVFTNYLEYISQKIKPKNRKSLSKYFELVILNFINEFVRIKLEENRIPSKRLISSPKVLFDNLGKLANEHYAKFIKLMVISPAFMPYYSHDFIEKLEKNNGFSSLLNKTYDKNKLNKIKEISKNFEKLIYIKES